MSAIQHLPLQFEGWDRITKSFHQCFPKTTVDAFALVLESGGNAGIMMYDLVAAVSLACLVKNLVIDPILEEESYQDGSLVLSCMPSRYEVTQLTFTGEWSTPDINEAMHLCLDAYNKLGKVTSTCLKEAAASASQE